jgi:hypothetical protein
MEKMKEEKGQGWKGERGKEKARRFFFNLSILFFQS